MTLRSRLAVGLVTITIILVGPLVFAIQSLRLLRDDAKELHEKEFAASLLIGRLRTGLSDLKREELALLFAKNAASRDVMEREVAHVGSLADSLAHFQLPEFAIDIGASVRQLAVTAPSEYGAALASDTARADSLSEHAFVPALTHADSLVLFAEDKLRERTAQRVADQAAATSRTTTVSIVALCIALGVAGLIAFFLTRSISHPIDELRSGMRAVADGDLSYRLVIPPDRSDELGQLAKSFREMSRQLAELDKLKAEFVSVASHELKTPINVMVGYLQLLDEGIYGPLTPKQQEVHRTLVTQANTLLRLVKQLLDVSRFEAGGGRLEPRDINVEEMLADLRSAFHVLAVQREINFRIERRAGVPDDVFWDLDRVNEVLGNLLSNAFKFTPRRGTVELIVDYSDGFVRMVIHDTGAGIPPEQLPRIFEKFYQADNQRSAQTAGSGLGLAIAKQIVEAHGGTISCDSKLGAGTRFTIKLPTRVARRTTAQRPVSNRPVRALVGRWPRRRA
jgi:signal transduction histidine kinase